MKNFYMEKIHPHILLVEDDPGISESLQFLLRQADYQVYAVSTAQEGFALLQEKNFSLLVLDLGLPDIDGLEFLKKLRVSYFLPVLILSARQEELDKILGLELGADDYVTKPFSNRELLARIKALLRRSSQGTEHTFLINRQAQHITYKGETLELSLQEYRILALLLSQPGWIFSREKIIELAWEDSTAVFDRTIDAHIKNIRHKLDVIHKKENEQNKTSPMQTAARSPLKTHRGMGYSIQKEL